jgi:hypothetical protein
MSRQALALPRRFRAFLLLSLLALLGAGRPENAQTTPQAFLGMVPALPEQPCGVGREEQLSFRNRVHDVDLAIQKELSRRHKEGKALQASNQGKVDELVVAARGGATPDELRGARAGGKAGRDAQSAMTTRQFGLSMDDIDALKGMTKEDRQAWATAHAGELGSHAPPGGAAQAAGGPGMKPTLGAKGLGLDTAARENDLKRRLEELDASVKPDRAELQRLEARAGGLEFTGDISAAQAAKGERLDRQVEAEKLAFCQRHGPALRALLAEYRDLVTRSIVEYDRVDADTAAFAKQATGMGPSGPQGQRALECVDRYVRVLADRAFSFDLTGGR